jgi:hypothetical protein
METTMHPHDMPAHLAEAAEAADAFSPLLREPVAHAVPMQALPAVVLGELLALADGGTQPLVRFPAGGDAAVPARSTVDLHGAHIGAQVVLVFEDGDPARPIVTGVLRGTAGWPLPEQPAQVQVDADGERLVVAAREQLVLRCGKSSITLTKAGKVLIEGHYLLTRSTGVNRVKGGSVQLN